MSIENQLLKILRRAIPGKKTLTAEEIGLAHPQNEDFGDYTTTVAMAIASKEKKNPHDIAEEIAGKIPTGDKSDLIQSVKVAGGFINITLKKSLLVEQVGEICSKAENYGNGVTQKNKRIMIEFGQPNTHKIPHIGHLFSYVLGESLARLTRSTGANIFCANYQGDVGPHVAKCLWAYLRDNPKDPKDKEKRAVLLQKMYQEGVKAYEDNKKAKNEIDELNVKIYKSDPSVLSLWKETRQWSIDHYMQFEKRLGTRFDRYYYESEVADQGRKIVEAASGKVFEQSEGAVIFDGEKYGLHKRVFITKNGTPTYEAKDMALQKIKYTEWPFDYMIITTANEQNEYFKVVLKALDELDPVFKGKIKHLGFGMVQLKSGKMSSRTGEIIGAIELVDQAVGAIQNIVKDREGLSENEKAKIAEVVGVGAVKWSFLKSNPLQNMTFDFKESVSFEGNSGPYIQYTYARAKSVLAEAGSYAPDKLDLEKVFTEKEEEALLKTLYKFPEVVAKAAEKLSPNTLCTYLFDLSQKFNAFYGTCRILQAESAEIKNSRLLLTAAAAQVIKNGLNLLGIEVLEKM